jgi:FixJ family two-component response regulator
VYELFTRPNLAIVDDDSHVLLSLDSLLRACGYGVQLFDSAEKLLACSTLPSLSCMVSDIQMPGMNGLLMYQQLLAQGYSIPIIFITASSDPVSRRSAEKLGAYGYLAKPFDSEMLIESIEGAIRSAGR